MFNKILIANRGEIACRIMRTAKRLGITCVAVYSEADRNAQHVQLADVAYHIGPSPATQSYLDKAQILSVAKIAKVDAIHPGYGFLAENADFAAECVQQGVTWIGPSVATMKAMATKANAKKIMHAADIPIIPGYFGKQQQAKLLAQKADDIGYPILIKPVAGGGGKGMHPVFDPEHFAESLDAAKRQAKQAFGSDIVLLERYLTSPRHIEVQIFADQQGNVVHLFERDCSVQRLQQKVIEESPALHLKPALREKMTACAVSAARAIGYVGAGTIEFLCDDDNFYFMEMNTRLQVEHAVTEKITGIDLVEWQLRVALGEPLPYSQSEIICQGHAIEARIYAENPNQNFLPITGTIQFLHTPPENERIRLDTGSIQGDSVTPYYDPLLSKLIAWGQTRDAALSTLQKALDQYQLVGITHNRNFLQQVLKHPDFVQGRCDVQWIERHLTELIISKSITDKALMVAALHCVFKQIEQANDEASQTQDPHSPWAMTDAFQLNTAYPSQQIFRFWVQGEYIGVKVTPNPALTDGFQITLPTTTYQVQAKPSFHGISLWLENRYETMTIVEYQDAIHVFYEDENFTVTRYFPSYESTHTSTQNHLIAPLSGTLIALCTNAGDTATKGSRLAIIEAMKMEHTIRAPMNGTLKIWHTNVGDLVKEGDILGEFVMEYDEHNLT